MELPEEYNKYHVFYNTLSLPLGYTYKNYILYDNYAPLTALQKQEALLQGVVLEEVPEGFGEIQPVDTCTEYRPVIKPHIIEGYILHQLLLCKIFRNHTIAEAPVKLCILHACL